MPEYWALVKARDPQYDQKDRPLFTEEEKEQLRLMKQRFG